MKILLMICFLPITVCAAMPLCGSASATIENRKGIYIFPPEEPVADELTSTPEDPEPTLVFDSEENLIVDEPNELIFTAEEQDLADTELFEE